MKQRLKLHQKIINKVIITHAVYAFEYIPIVNCQTNEEKKDELFTVDRNVCTTSA